MNKPELIIKMQEKLNSRADNNITFTKKDAEIILDSVGEIITDALIKGDDVKIPFVGTFSVVKKDARTARNPRTREVVNVAAKNAPHFSAAKTLKNAIN